MGAPVKTIATTFVALGLVAYGATSATAADLRARPAYKAEQVSVVPYHSWTGFYIGAHLGGAWAKKDWSENPIGSIGSHVADGFIGGFQVGYNWQTGPWVFGIEGQFSWGDLTGSHVFSGDTFQTKVDALGSVAGRIGYAWDRMMVYGKGGWAYAHDKYTSTAAGGVALSDTRSGWMVGLGLEYAFAPNWSVKVEYNYLDFGSESITAAGVTGEIDQYVNLVKVGINYRFGGKGKAPVTTRY
jgi:outer membrane immunogenic protein